MTKMFSPRLVLPASAVVSGPVGFCIGFVVNSILVGIYGIRPGAAALFFLVLLLVAVLTLLGIGWWVSRSTPSFATSTTSCPI